MSNQQTLPGTKHVSHRNKGKSFEIELEAMHDVYRRKGWVDMVKNANEWRYIGFENYNAIAARRPRTVAKTADGICLQMQQSNVDFSGGNGFGAYLFDAKETAKDSFPFSSIAEHQVRRLLMGAQCGATSGVMIKFTTLDRVFFVSIRAFNTKFDKWFIKSQFPNQRAEKGTANFSIREIEEIGVEIPKHKPTSYPDWFSVLMK